jgi:hypothetical protein
VLFAEMLLVALAVYLGCGLLFGAAFVVAGVGRVDAAARGSSVLFRLFILPGTVALWPLLARQWWAAVKKGGSR